MSGSDASRGAHSGPPLPPATFAGFLIALAAVGLIAFFSYGSLQSRSDSANRVTQTLEVRQHLQQLFSLLKDAETGQRGFLLTGEESYLAPYSSAKAQLPAELKRLQTLMSDNPPQQQRLDVLDQLIAEKMNELAQTIDLRRGDRADLMDKERRSCLPRRNSRPNSGKPCPQT